MADGLPKRILKVCLHIFCWNLLLLMVVMRHGVSLTLVSLQYDGGTGDTPAGRVNSTTARRWISQTEHLNVTEQNKMTVVGKTFIHLHVGDVLLSSVPLSNNAVSSVSHTRRWWIDRTYDGTAWAIIKPTCRCPLYCLLSRHAYIRPDLFPPAHHIPVTVLKFDVFYVQRFHHCLRLQRCRVSSVIWRDKPHSPVITYPLQTCRDR